MDAKVVLGQPSISLESEEVVLSVSLKGGHLAPVGFRFGGVEFRPLHVAPWAEDKLSEVPPIIEVLRGDFFCLPFGGNASIFEAEAHPIHGATANREWTPLECEPGLLRFELKTGIRPGSVVKEVFIRPGQHAVYQRHLVEGSGPMSYGHHAMLAFPDPVTGKISTSRFAYGQVYPFAFENPAEGGYTSLLPGSRFSSLQEVQLAGGGSTDLTVYPAREGFEDLVQIFADPRETLAWTACVFSTGFVWLSLRNSNSLTGTVMWHSNGGRHYAPWSGRHRRVLGLEDVTSFFHTGLKESVEENEASRAGFITHAQLPIDVRTIMAAAAVPAGFDQVAEITRTSDGICIRSTSGRTVDIQVDLKFLELD